MAVEEREVERRLDEAVLKERKRVLRILQAMRLQAEYLIVNGNAARGTRFKKRLLLVQRVVKTIEEHVDEKPASSIEEAISDTP